MVDSASGNPACDFNRPDKVIDREKIMSLSAYGPIFWDLFYYVIGKLSCLDPLVSRIVKADDVDQAMKGQWY